MNILKLEPYIEPKRVRAGRGFVPADEYFRKRSTVNSTGQTTPIKEYKYFVAGDGSERNPCPCYKRNDRPWTHEECMELEKKHGYVETLTIAYLNKLPIVQWPSHVDQFDPHSAMEIQRLNDVNRAMMNQMLITSRGYGYNDSYQSMLNDMEYFRQLAMTQVNVQTSIAYNFEPIKA